MAKQLLNQILTEKNSYFDFYNLRFPTHSPVHLRKFDLSGKTYSVIDSISRGKIGNAYREVCKIRDGEETGYIAVEYHPKSNEHSDADLKSSSANWEVVLISDIEEERIEALKIAKYTPSARKLEEALAAV